MAINFRNYKGKKGISEDYYLVRDFLINLGYAEYTYVRWDWMITHSMLDVKSLDKIGLWFDDDRLVGLVTYDLMLGQAFCLTQSEYDHLKIEMLPYASKHLSKEDGSFGITIADDDTFFQDVAARAGYKATTSRESDAIFYVDNTSTDYTLPDGYEICSMKTDYDLHKYTEVLYKGFNHELNGEGPLKYTEVEKKLAAEQMERENVDLELKIAVKNSKGEFISYCGMWYDEEAGYAVIEPVATVPEYRKLGLGKAAVLEGIKRVGEMGAKHVLVGSSQQFYYSIGLRPYATATIWKK